MVREENLRHQIPQSSSLAGRKASDMTEIRD
ncbi:uncharacterized protein G2W53_000684 [Senna tora]|uniref:Uncharacterized protein n=1 Tax=Senna tora TaxID=362788 RepID=A0A835CIR0_9FABA|nr:uncharacterized protein G2W53_000684 [Senna tora]